jgi:hypothetical protein
MVVGLRMRSSTAPVGSRCGFNFETLCVKRYSHLKEGGKYLLVEPRIHTSRPLFDEEVNICRHIGFEQLSRPHVRVSRAALFKKNEK